MIEFERIKEILKPEEFKKFNRFMFGQTFQIKDKKSYVYDDDFIRFVNKDERL